MSLVSNREIEQLVERAGGTFGVIKEMYSF